MAESPLRRGLLSTSEGLNLDAFTGGDWLRFAAIAAIGGSVFMLIAVGLDAFAPGFVAWARCAVAAVCLRLLPAGRVPIERNDRGRVWFVAVTWTVVPFILFPVAQQWVSSATAGMMNGGIPIAVAVIATLMLRRLPGRPQLAGLAVGFAGLGLVGGAAGAEGTNQAVGVVLMVVAVCSYGLAFNVAAPLQQRYGAVALMARLLAMAALLTAPLGFFGLGASRFEWLSLGAIVALGVATAALFSLLADLVGRVGSTRASVSMYLVPIVALILGNVIRGETIHSMAIMGVALVVIGAAMATRRDQGRR